MFYFETFGSKFSRILRNIWNEMVRVSASKYVKLDCSMAQPPLSSLVVGHEEGAGVSDVLVVGAVVCVQVRSRVGCFVLQVVGEVGLVDVDDL